ncbi:MAG: hypothetical protein PHF86_10365 [Candidatus Nanoarchaeia archaeon]|nr:hypothetical protein [Candidatus Nanoarchaeia archaeon]
MKNTLYIYSQTQIGDHILCYSIVKFYAKQYDNIILLTRDLGSRHMENLRRLYSSLPSVSFIPFPNHESTLLFIKLNQDNNYLIFGHEDFVNALNSGKAKPFDEHFYETAKVPFNNKWDEFYFERDLEKEKDVFYNKLKLKDDEEFIFIHQDPAREYFIDKKYIDNTVKRIRLEDLQDICLFDFFYTLERAKEIHEINSSMLTLIDIMQLKVKGKLFYHKYVRGSFYEQPRLKLNWQIIE